MVEEKMTPKSILIVDDQEGVRVTLSLILSKKGFQVEEADDGLTALEAVRLRHFDVILMDIKMPGMNGLDAFIQIKALSPQSMVIMMTAGASEQDINMALSQGVYTVLYKPFGIDTLMDVLHQCLDEGRHTP